MSDSDDFGGFTPTTPLPVRKLPPGTAAAGPSRAVNKGKAANAPLSIRSDDDDIQEVPKEKGGKRGPHGATSLTTVNRKRKKDDDPEEAEDENETKKRRGRHEEGNEEERGYEEQVPEVPPPAAAAKRVRGSSRKPTSRPGKGEATVNGTTRGVKGKGKTKAKATAIIDLDDVDSLNFEEENARVEVENLANVITASVRPQKQGNTRTKHDECARLREQLQQAQGHIEDLKRHIEELHQVKTSEPEVLLQRMDAQHQKVQQSNEALINDLTERLARKDSLLRMNRNSVFELLTREEANKETQALRDQVRIYQDAIRERDQIVKEKDEEIGGLKASVDDLRYELQLEIERAKNLSSQKQPDSSSRTRRGRVLSHNEDPKMAEVVRFYEDLSNLLVMDVKPQPARYLQLEDWLLTCVFSYRDVVDKRSSAKSLSFKLRLCFEPNPNLQGEPKTKSDLAESLQYTPLELDKETEEFVQSLGFLNNSFTFERSQLALFLRTLHDVVSGDGNGDDSASEDGIRVIG